MTPERWRQLEELFHAARERGRSVLADADPELRNEVEALLAADNASAMQTQLLSKLSQLGPYKIEAPLGAGGMGEVFRARDTRLGRTVAIKILPRDKVADPERKRRFMQEARAASALNHPNIVTLHDIANDGGVDYLVMELVEGKSLDMLITPRGMPPAEAIGYTTQIANALAAAHAAGIVHRDIKPANVIVNAEGQLKVLDFGLAKLTERAAGNADEAVTQEPALTEAGMVIGTVSYMSPEQASGRTVDHRTDIFSLGVMLHEMLAGQRPFQSKSHVETMNAIINRPAPLLKQQPPELQEVLDKTLAKDARQRYQHAGDLALDLHRYQHRPPRAHVAPGTQSASRLHWIAAAVLLLAIPAAWWTGQRGASSALENPLANAKFTRLTDFEGIERDAAVSPDGKFVSFVSDQDGQLDIWLTQIGSARFVNLTQGKVRDLDSSLPVGGFTRDGTQIWFHDRDPMSPVMVIPLMGGPPRPFLARSPVKTAPMNAHWSPDGQFLVYHTSDPGDPMFVTDYTGASARRIFIDPSGGLHNHHPMWSIDGRWIFFIHGTPTTGEMDLFRISANGGDPERLTQQNAVIGYPSPISEETVLYVARDTDGSGPWLWACDVRRKTSRRISFGLEKYTSVAASADGRRLVATVNNPQSSLWSIPILERTAEERDVKRFVLPSVRGLAPRFRGNAMFYLSSTGTGDGLWRYEDNQAIEIWKGSEGGLLEPAAISSDGGRVAFVRRQSGRLRLHTMTADGSELRPIGEAIDVRGSVDWSPDGNWIVAGGDDGQGLGLFKIPVDGGAPIRLVKGPSSNPVWSPNGKLIIYTGANVAALAPLAAIDLDGNRVEIPPILVRREGQRMRFLPDGKGLVYMQGETARQDFWLLDFGTRQTRMLARLNNPASMLSFDVTPDAKQIVFDRSRENSDIVLIDLPK